MGCRARFGYVGPSLGVGTADGNLLTPRSRQTRLATIYAGVPQVRNVDLGELLDQRVHRLADLIFSVPSRDEEPQPCGAFFDRRV
jgi:hypothetical protein